ncbi:MAG: PRC-barrel domain-containing protein, partial [Ktedonobacterales bacterium]
RNMLEDLRIGAHVTGSDDKRLGTLTRIVIERADPRVTHLVVDPGLAESGNMLSPGGWEKPRERVVPVELITSTTPEAIRLTCDEPYFLSQALFEQVQFNDAEPSKTYDQPAHWWSRFQLEQVVNYISSGWGLGAAPYVGPETITYNESAGSSEIEEGTAIWRGQPPERVGTVTHVLLDNETQRVTSYVIRRHGGLAGELIVFPVSAIASIDDDAVFTALTDEQLEHLAPYEHDE